MMDFFDVEIKHEKRDDKINFSFRFRILPQIKIRKTNAQKIHYREKQSTKNKKFNSECVRINSNIQTVR